MQGDKERLIYEILNRGTEDILVRESLEEKLRSGKTLTIKLGIDPTSPNLHLGRAIPLRKLKQFQDLGHKVVLLIGDFTARIGDPSDKLEKRPLLTHAEIKKNMAGYKKQAGKILNLRKTKFVYNSKWLSRLKFEELCRIAEVFSVNQLSARRNFKERLQKGGEISLREFLYPLMQGYDSVKLKADVEIGGFDQLFNLRAGRAVQKLYGQEEQDILTTTMLEGTDGRKMSSSWGNVIALTDAPNDMFGKVMRVSDDLIAKYFLLCTDLPQEQIDEYEKKLHNGTNPRDIKLILAEEITRLYHGEDEAHKAREYFVSTFSKKELPKNPDININAKTNEELTEVLVREGFVPSKSEYKRKREEGAVYIDGERVVGDYYINKDVIIKIGKKIGKIHVT